MFSHPTMSDVMYRRWDTSHYLRNISFHDYYRQQSNSERKPGVWTHFISFIQRRYKKKEMFLRDTTESPLIHIAKTKSEFMISRTEENDTVLQVY